MMQEAIDCLEDVVSHYGSFYKSLTANCEASLTQADRLYYQHELDALTRMKTQAKIALLKDGDRPPEINIEDLAERMGELQRNIRNSLANKNSIEVERAALSNFSSYLAIHGIVALNRRPGEGQEGDLSHMVRIKDLIARLQSTLDQFGNTCVYIRRGGLSWGAVALNRRDDDQKHGIFDLQDSHDIAMRERLGQCDRLIETAKSERELRWAAETENKALKERMKAAGIEP